jgi:hypothetical protein
MSSAKEPKVSTVMMGMTFISIDFNPNAERVLGSIIATLGLPGFIFYVFLEARGKKQEARSRR